MSTTAALLGIFLLGVLLNALFAGYETGFIGVNQIRVRHRAEKERHTEARRLLIYLDHPERMITLVLVGTNIALIMGTIAITKQLEGVWATLVATPVFLAFGELIPKSIFRVHPTRLSLGFLPVIRFFDAVLAPVVLPVTWLSRPFTRIIEGEQNDIRHMMSSQDDVRVLVDESADHGAIEPEEQEMIHNVMDLQTQNAREVMVPRINVCALPETATRAELLATLKKSGFTRIPVYRETVDDITGVINAFDVLRDETPEKDDVHRFVRDILHVPDTMKLDDILKKMRDAKQSMAVVVDEYGGTDGIIAIEDILEEIFGEIHDEYDKAEASIHQVGPDAYVVDARTELEDVTAAVGIALDDADVETIGGWLMHVTGRIPAQGEVITQARLRITVLAATASSVTTLRLDVLPPAKEDAVATEESQTRD